MARDLDAELALPTTFPPSLVSTRPAPTVPAGVGARKRGSEDCEGQPFDRKAPSRIQKRRAVVSDGSGSGSGSGSDHEEPHKLAKAAARQQVSETPQDKRERNKLSASNYRKRRKMHVTSLEEQVGELGAALQAQHSTIDTLSTENKALKQELSVLRRMFSSIPMPALPSLPSIPYLMPSFLGTAKPEPTTMLDSAALEPLRSDPIPLNNLNNLDESFALAEWEGFGARSGMDENLDSFGGNTFLLDEMRNVAAGSSFGARTGMSGSENLTSKSEEKCVRKPHVFSGTWRKLVALLLFGVVVLRLFMTVFPIGRPLMRVL